MDDFNLMSTILMDRMWDSHEHYEDFEQGSHVVHWNLDGYKRNLMELLKATLAPQR